jgi:hypothetical protein
MTEKKELWKKRVADWRASGETAKRYSAGRGWSAGTLLWWSSRLGREAPPPPTVRIAQLVRSPVPHDRGAAAGAIIIELLDARVRITVDGGADREAVTAVLAVLSKVER